MTIYRKVVLFVLLLVLPLNLLALSVTRKAVDTTIEQTTATDRQFAENGIAQLNKRMDSAFSMLYYFVTEDSDCIQMMRQRDEYSYVTAKNKFFVALKKLAHMTDGADGYFFFLQKKQDSLYYGNEQLTAGFKSALAQTVEGLEGKQWSICTVDDALYLLLVQEANSTRYGAWIDLDAMRQEIIEGLDYTTTQAMFYQKDVPELEERRVGASAAGRGVTLLVSQSREDVLQSLSPRVRFLYAAAVLYLIVIPLLCWFINVYLLQPLKTVTRANREMQIGNLDYRITEKARSPEYDAVFQSFNSMAADLKSYKIECYEKEMERQKIELRNLQLQIRPHFLLNIFNLIYTLAQRKQSAQIEDTVMYLSDYFRFLFRSNRDTEPFGKELGIIRGYLTVANIRYHDLIDAVLDVAPEVERVCIPPLLIHNFVENTIKHGVCRERVLHVRLTGRYHGGEVCFCIEDDGNGMDAQTLERNRSIFAGTLNLEDQNEHLGLYNSFRRLRAFFGDDASVTVESEPNRFTRFVIQFPYDLGGNYDAFDCK